MLSAARPIGPVPRADGLRISACSPPVQRLIRLLQKVGFGRIEDLRVEGGQPVFDPSPRIIRSVRLARDDESRPEANLADFALKAEVVALINHIARIRTGTVRVLQVQHGLPVSMEIEEAAA